MPLNANDQHHPEALQECLEIADAVRNFNSIEHGHALSSLGAAFDSLFSGPGMSWLGARATLGDLCSHVPGTSNPKLFLEPFYGNGNEGVVAAFCETATGRPVLLSVVAFSGPKPTDAPNRATALVLALRHARRRVADV